MRTRPSRRALLSVAGASVAGTLLPAGWARAHAPVKRLVVFVTQHQMMPEAWLMRRGRPARQAFSYPLAEVPMAEWSRTLAPLAHHGARLNIIEGLAQVTALPAKQEVNEHDAATNNLLTAAGVHLPQPKTILGPSFDQVVAAHIAAPGQLRSLELGMNPYLGGFSATGLDARLPSLASPEQAFLRVFPELRTETGPTSDRPELDLAAHRRRQKLNALRGRVVAHVRAQAARLSVDLGRESRAHLDAHESLLRDLERRLDVFGAHAACTPPEERFPAQVFDNRLRFELFVRIVAAAFACDRTRVVVLQPRELFNADFGAPPGDVHQDFAHNAHLDERAAEAMSNYNRVYARYFATLLDALAAIPEGEATLLDNCLVVWMSEHGLTRAPHTLYECPVVIAGTAGGALRTGRYLSVPRRTPHPRAPEALIGTPHSHLLVSLVRAMGVPVDTIGLRTQAIAGGGSIDLSGPLVDL